MANDARNPKATALPVIAILVGLALIAVGVYARESIGSFASWLVMSAGIVIALALPALWRRRSNRPSE